VKVHVKTPARLHLGLIDLNGNLGRMFGGFGVGINQPNVVLEAEQSEKLSVTGEETELVKPLVKRFFSAYPTKANVSVSINVKQTIPTHVGLGSGTQLSLAVATALAKLYNVKASTHELAFAMGRARRTGVGTAIFEKGGFVVDGGKIVNNSACFPEKFPPLIFRQPFPEDWRFVVAVPNVNKGLSNAEETSAFSQLPQMQAEDVGKICRLTMMKLLPALAEHDIENFGDALTSIQIVIGEYFAQVQGGRYSNSAATDGIEFMQKIGAYGVGQSSWGPALYGVVKKEEAKQTLLKVQAHLKKNVDGQVFIAKANNRGAYIKFTK
jgi:beta-ribofuranosylaminobenzene 5'-phosphate synthase